MGMGIREGIRAPVAACVSGQWKCSQADSSLESFPWEMVTDDD